MSQFSSLQRFAGNWLELDEVVDAFLDLDPDYIMHNSERVARRSMGTVEELTPEMREEVREVTAMQGTGVREFAVER